MVLHRLSLSVSHERYCRVNEAGALMVITPLWAACELVCAKSILRNSMIWLPLMLESRVPEELNASAA